MSKVHSSRISLVLFTVPVAIFLFNVGTTSAMAQGFPGLLNPWSPLFSFPHLEAEAQLRLIDTQILSGNVVPSAPDSPLLPLTGRALDLRNDLGMTSPAVFLDFMVRAQLWRLSFRLNYSMRDYEGNSIVVGVPVHSRFDYTGLRLGGDFDVVQWGRSRAGIDLDYDLYAPYIRFRYNTAGGATEIQFDGSSAATLGTYIVYNPTFTLYGVSGIAEARARWPVSGAQVTDWEVAGGLKSPETVLGSVALRGGYRHTAIEFSNLGTDVNVDIGGWFGEIVYYY